MIANSLESTETAGPGWGGGETAASLFHVSEIKVSESNRDGEDRHHVF